MLTQARPKLRVFSWMNPQVYQNPYQFHNDGSLTPVGITTFIKARLLNGYHLNTSNNICGSWRYNSRIPCRFFSFLNLVSSKENKISESRLDWIDGLRNEIAAYSSAIQELARLHSGGLYRRLESHDDETYNKLKREKYEKTKETYAKAAENLTKIQLRLNQKHIKEDPDGHEAKLMAAILKARADFNNAEYFKAFKCCGDISTTAAPLLKSTWDLVKNGEPGYLQIRETALKAIKAGMIFIGVTFLALIIVTFTPSSTGSKNLIIQNLHLDIERLQNSKNVTQSGSHIGKLTDPAKASDSEIQRQNKISTTPPQK